MMDPSATADHVRPPALEDAAYRAALDFIFHRLNYERVSQETYDVEDFRLARMARLLELLGHPEERLPIVHVAGTKGKGSTSAMLAAMLQAAGLRVGLFTSPHLLRFEERLTVNGVEPTHAELVQLVETLRGPVEQLAAEMPPGPTYFEIATALGWLHYTAQNCDIAVLEVGLGGRLDSTNLCRPLCSIITSISRDHMRLLGDTLSLIAAEKAGIIKPGVPVLSGVMQPEPAAVIEGMATRMQSPLYRLANEIHVIPRTAASDPFSLPYSKVDIETPWRRHENLVAPLPGPHQCRNLALAVTAFDLLNQTWRPLDPAAIRRGISGLRWPLRIEQISDRPRVILDTAHNDASMTALGETLAPLKHRRRVLIFATSRDKDAVAMLRILNTCFDEVILTRYVRNPRALAVDQLVPIAEDALSIPFDTAEDPLSAWRLARARTGPDDLICVTGSLFLAAEMLELIRGGG